MEMDRNSLIKGVILDPAGNLKLQVSGDGMSAFISGDLKAGQEFLKDNIRQILQDAGICHGILPSPRLNGSTLIVAEGEPPKKGRDGKIVTLAKSWLRKREIEQEDEARRDPKNLYSILNVSSGEIIAKKIPPTVGDPGRNVFGEEIPGEPGEWVALKPGEGVEIIEGTKLISSRDGCLIVDSEGRYSVYDEWRIEGDVDSSTGHVEFWGKHLEIAGSVQSGFVVDVAGSLLIKGNIEDEVTILAGGNVEVEGLIRSSKTGIKVGGDLTCGAVEYASVFVAGDLYVQDYLLDATCEVEGEVSVTGGKGLIAGGSLRLGGSLTVKTIGTQAYVPTFVAAGYAPLSERYHEALEKDIRKLAGKMAQIREGLDRLAMLEKAGKLGPEHEQTRQALKAALDPILAELDKKRAELRELEKQLGQLDRASIIILGTAYPSVVLAIAGAQLKLNSAVKSIQASFRKGEIVLTTLEPSQKKKTEKKAGA